MPCTHPFWGFVVLFLGVRWGVGWGIGSHYEAQAGLELRILLPQLLDLWMTGVHYYAWPTIAPATLLVPSTALQSPLLVTYSHQA